jgi:GNAT superfamily N-acetyltransferase
MILDKLEIEFSAKVIGEIDSGEKDIFLENRNTKHEIYSRVFYKSNREMAGVFFSSEYFGNLRIHIAFEEDPIQFNEDISTIISSTIQKSGLHAGRIWIKNDNRNIIEYLKQFFHITPNCGIYDYASEEYILRRENYKENSENHSLVIKPFEAESINKYLILLDNAMTFVNPPPNYLGHKDDFSKLFEKKKAENSFEAFWESNKELIGLYWRDGAEIDIMAVSANHQRQGYGALILSRAIEMALNNTDKEFVYLYAVDWNEKGRKFYRKFGMELNAHCYSFNIENFH